MRVWKMITKRTSGIVLLCWFIGSWSFAITGLSLAASSEDSVHRLTDFTQSSPDLGWYIQNDSVMGGLSNGQFELRQGVLIFTGNTNTNGGGFSSIRTQSARFDLSAHSGIRLKIKGDGRRYTWHLQTDATWRGRRISYWADFETESQQWATIDIPFDDFEPQFRGFKLDGPALDQGRISELGLYIYDKLDGPFELHLDKVMVYSED